MSSTLEFDSTGEEFFYEYFKEIKDNGYIEEIELQPDPFILTEKTQMTKWEYTLKTKVKETTRLFLPGSIYTTDMKITWNPNAYGIFYETNDIVKYNSPFLIDSIGNTENGKAVSYIECKPDFDHNNMTRLAKSNIKFVYHLYKTYVQIVTTDKFFNETFAPLSYRIKNKKKRKSKSKLTFISFKDYLDNRLTYKAEVDAKIKELNK